MPKLKLYICLTIALITAVTAFAVPARRGYFIQQQPDGTSITLCLQGDENYHYLTDTSGNIIMQDDEGWYRTISPSEMSDIQSTSDVRKVKRAAKRQTAGYTDYAQHGLIILANFSDLEFQAENTQESMQQMFSGEDYDYNGATGSAQQYFSDQSGGRYVPQFDVIGPITLPNTMAYYGSNNRTFEDIRPHIAVKDACRMADTIYNVDFSKYDNDNDGIVDFVYLIYAGYNEAEGASTTTIWPHAWNLLDAGLDIVIDGKQIAAYACSSELRDYKGNERAGIGTFCHEFSHILGLPDLYSTDNSSSHQTLGSWDIMDLGAYNNNGRTPASYSAYERFYLGWSRPVLLNTPNHYMLKDIQQSNTCAMITQKGESNINPYNPNPNVFYLLENRQQTSWDTYLPGHGLMITKIQYDADLWINNIINNDPNYMGVDIIEAGGQKADKKSSPDDLFPTGASKYVPYTFYPVLDIEENEDGIITFRFMSGGNADEPVEITDSTIISDIGLITLPISDYSKIDTIYTIAGQILLNSPTKTAILNLPHGIYIAVMSDQSVCKIII